MGFRDDNEALRAKVRALEEENEGLRHELKKERGELVEEIPVADGSGTDDLASLVASREAEEQASAARAKRNAAIAKQKQLAKLAKRPRRVVATKNDEGIEVRIASKLMADKMWEQAGWGIGFAFINPGIFIVMGIAAMLYLSGAADFGLAAGLAVPIWTVLLLAINLVVASVTRPSWRMTFTHDGHFAIYKAATAPPHSSGARASFAPVCPSPEHAFRTPTSVMAATVSTSKSSPPPTWRPCAPRSPARE